MKNFPEKELARLISQDIKWGREFRDTRKADWLRFYVLYKNWIDRAEYPYESNLAIPSAYANVEVQTAFLLDMIFESGDFVEVLGKTQTGQLSASAVREMLNYHFRESFRTYEDMEQLIRNLLIFGTSIYKVYWDWRREYQTQKIPMINPATGEPEYGKFEERLIPVEVANNPSGYPIDLLNFFVDPNANTIENARFAGEDQWISPDRLLELSKAYPGYMKKNVAMILGEDMDDDVNINVTEKLDEIGITDNQKSPYLERGKVHVVDYWGYLATGWKNGRLSENSKTQLIHAVLAVGNSSAVDVKDPVILLAEPTPFNHGRLPYVDFRINSCVGEFYGQGDIEYCESLYLEQRDQRNVQMDNLSRTANQMWKVKNGAVLDESELTHRPGGIVHVDEIDNLLPIETPRIDPSHFKSQDDIRRDIEMATGVNDFVMGQYRSSMGFNDTATGISLIQQTALMRLGQKGQIMQRGIRDVAKLAFGLIQQFQSDGTSVRILDREGAMKYRFINILPQELMNAYDFNIINAPSLGSKPMRVNQLIQLLQIVIQAQQPTPERPKGGMSPEVSRLYKRIVEDMDVPNPQELAGFPDLNMEIPEIPGDMQGEDQPQLPPEEENRVMIIEGRAVHAKFGEPHQQHILVHNQGLEMAQDDTARVVIADHMKEHRGIMAQEKAMAAEMMGTSIEADAMQEQQQQMALVTGGKGAQKSPSSAEGQARGMGNMMGGQAF